MRPHRKKIRIALISLVLVYLLGGILLYFGQDRLLFHPKSLPANHRFSFDIPFEELNVPFEGSNLSIIKFRPAKSRKGIVLFYHGNMRNVEHYNKYPALFVRNGYEIWMIDYPGFGKTTGTRSEERIYRQALRMYELAAQETAADSLIIYGKSIGTGVASYVASNRPCKELILETPYYSIDALAKHYFPIYPVLPMTSYSFPTYRYLSQVKVPVTIFHGTNDEIIPFRQAQRLKKERAATELIVIEKGKHNNLFDFELYQQKMDSILQR